MKRRLVEYAAPITLGKRATGTIHRALICRLALLLVFLPFAAQAETADPIEAGIREIQKYGSIVLTISGNSMPEMGCVYGGIPCAAGDWVSCDRIELAGKTAQNRC